MNEMWVPVAEGLPDEEGMYIVCFIDGFGKANVFIWSFHEGEHMSGKQTYVDGKHYWAAVSGGEPVNKFLSNRVVAWMPLPEPYEAKENVMSLKGLRRGGGQRRGGGLGRHGQMGGRRLPLLRLGLAARAGEEF